MKRMSEVFELPVDHKKLEVYGAGEMDGVPYHVAEEHAAHAINSCDALADALELFLVFKADVNKGLADDDVLWLKAESALDTYRGTK